VKRRERQALLDAEQERAAQAASHPDDTAAGARPGTATAGARPEPAQAHERPSKSQRKRDMTALQALGEELLALQPSKLLALPLPPALADAIELARRITSHEGLRRQRQYIGRLMRDVDPAPIRAALDRDGAGHRAEVAAMHAAERWRERLLADPRVLAEFLERFPEPAPPGAADQGAPEGDDTVRDGRSPIDQAPDDPGFADDDIDPAHAQQARGASRAPRTIDWPRLVDDARAEHARGETGRRCRDLYRKLRDRIAAHTTSA